MRQCCCLSLPPHQLQMSLILQQLTMMSGLSQIGLQTGGVIGSKDDMPIVSGTAPSFHLRVDASSVKTTIKLQRINKRWLVSRVFRDEILAQMLSSMSQVLGAMLENGLAGRRSSGYSRHHLGPEQHRRRQLLSRAYRMRWEEFSTCFSHTR